jgi:uncharacterized protein YbjT (DUF2867 family)
MKTVIFGATGMVGRGVLLECLDDARVKSVLIVGRSPAGVAHAKVREVIHEDFFDFTAIAHELRGLDACFFCLGVTSVGLSESEYRRLTYDLTLKAAEALAAGSPGLTFCYVSGAGTDSSERGRRMWARVKGATENALRRLPFKAVFLFRPGYIQPLRGIRSKTRIYQAIYNVVKPLYPLLVRLFPAQLTTTAEVGQAMIEAASNGYERAVVEIADIHALARRVPPATRSPSDPARTDRR